MRAECAKDREEVRAQMKEQLEISRCGVEAELEGRKKELEQSMQLQLAEQSKKLDRDRADELEMIISKLDAEFCETKRDLESESRVKVEEAEAALQAVREKASVRQKQLEHQVQMEQSKRLHCTEEMQAHITELERQLQSQQAASASKDEVVASKEAEVAAVRGEAEKSEQMLRLTAAQEVQKVQDELEGQQQEYNRAQQQVGILQGKLATERAAHKEEKATIKAQRSKELEDVSLRVRTTVEKKDMVIRGLQQQLNDLEASLQNL
eukprot:TRINITY_DN2480_c0_g1_i4.p1 TRINITY_DN2480_c0_g1~~TRINITY_DN2480_c0_g1_i4.p1  ORF type:complete len:266 (+),score=123.91 TRINITY_DN2480_c0_g1_i4:877-1674(+)